MPVKDKKALNSMTRARTCLMVRQPFFGCLSLQLELVEVEDAAFVDTMAVDGKHLFYHPPFVHGLTENHTVGVIAHEVYHCAYKHMTRRGYRDHQLYNIAGDFVINFDAKTCGFELPGDPISLADIMKYKPKKGEQPKKGHLYDPHFANMSTEEVYEILLSKAIKIKIECWGGDPGGCGGVRDAKTAGNEDGKDDKNGKVNDLSASQVAEIDAEWEANVRMAVNIAKRANAGSIPGHLRRLVEELEKPRINWRDQLRDFISNSMSKDYSWARPNRRSVACGLLLPGFISDAIQHMVVVMDCSGSIDEKIMKIYASEAGGALDDGVCDKMTVVYTDTEVKRVDEFLKGDCIKVDTPGGGGTHFDAVMKWISEQCSDAACIVFLTDMMTGSWGQDPDIPVLWSATLPMEHLKTIHPPFGRVIQVSEG